MATPMNSSWTCAGVVNRFGRQVVHDGLDMQVRRGEVFGILGGSGSGKSVLLRTILGLRRPQAGSVRVEGVDMTQLDEQGAARWPRPATASPSSMARCSRR